MNKLKIEEVKKTIEEYEKNNHWWFWISNKMTDFENRLEKQLNIIQSKEFRNFEKVLEDNKDIFIRMSKK